MAESSAGPLLRIENLRAVYNGAVVAFTRVDLDVRPRELVALLGANGAGKTTVLRAVSNLLPAVRGRAHADAARFDGANINELSPGKLARLGLVPVLEGRRVFATLTVEENLIAGAVGVAKSWSTTSANLERVYAFFPKLAERRGSPPVLPPAASNRCSPSAGLSWPNRDCSRWMNRRWGSRRSSFKTFSAR